MNEDVAAILDASWMRLAKVFDVLRYEREGSDRALFNFVFARLAIATEEGYKAAANKSHQELPIKL